MARGSHQEAVVEALSNCGADEREIFICLLRSGMRGGEPASFSEIGAACGVQFGYPISKQRAHKIMKAIAERMGREQWEALFAGIETMRWIDPPTQEDYERMAIRRRQRIEGTMRSQAKKMPGPLQYLKVLEHFGVEVPPRRDRTAHMLDEEESMLALHEDFSVIEACGWRVCPDCKKAKRKDDSFYKYRGTDRAVAWCKECNTIRWRKGEEKRKALISEGG